jgi:hypothetical protein
MLFRSKYSDTIQIPPGMAEPDAPQVKDGRQGFEPFHQLSVQWRILANLPQKLPVFSPLVIGTRTQLDKDIPMRHSIIPITQNWSLNLACTILVALVQTVRRFQPWTMASECC